MNCYLELVLDVFIVVVAPCKKQDQKLLEKFVQDKFYFSTKSRNIISNYTKIDENILI